MIRYFCDICDEEIKESDLKHFICTEYRNIEIKDNKMICLKCYKEFTKNFLDFFKIANIGQNIKKIRIGYDERKENDNKFDKE